MVWIANGAEKELAAGFIILLIEKNAQLDVNDDLSINRKRKR